MKQSHITCVECAVDFIAAYEGDIPRKHTNVIWFCTQPKFLCGRAHSNSVICI